MIELATKTITAESRMGSHKDMIGTTVPPCESALGNACAVLDSPKPTPVGQASQPTHDPDRTRKAFLRRPERLARFMGEPRNFSRNSSSEISANHASAGLISPPRG